MVKSVSLPEQRSTSWSMISTMCGLLLITESQTPDPGINFDSTAVLSSPLDDLPKEAASPLGWFRTMIQFSDKTIAFRWADHSQGTFLCNLSLCSIYRSQIGERNRWAPLTMPSVRWLFLRVASLQMLGTQQLDTAKRRTKHISLAAAF